MRGSVTAVMADFEQCAAEQIGPAQHGIFFRRFCISRKQYGGGAIGHAQHEGVIIRWLVGRLIVGLRGKNANLCLSIAEQRFGSKRDFQLVAIDEPQRARLHL